MSKHPKLAFKVAEKSRNVHTVKQNVKSVKGWEQWFLLRSDAHHDNAHCDLKKEKKHLDQAIERGAGILDAGDLFCAMQGKWDKRKSREGMRDEYLEGNYLDLLVQHAADFFYEPYAKNWILMAPGNHEHSIVSHHETDLTDRLLTKLNERTGSQIYRSGYSGWVRFTFNLQGSYYGFKLWFIHGYGGGGPVTRGVIQSNRRAVYVADADIVWSGHTHDQWILPITKTYLNQQDKVVHRDQYHISSAGYKEEYGDGYGGWHIHRGAPPKPTGAMWLRFYCESSREGIRFEIMEAR